MNCKHCNAEMADTAKFCAECGRPVNEPEQTAPVEETSQGPEIVEEKKTGAGKIALAVVAVAVVLAILVSVVVGGLGGEELFTGNDATVAPTSAPVAETVEATEATAPADTGADDTTCKGSYTTTDEELIAAADTVVATMGDATLTVSQLQVFYWTEVIYFLQDYGGYAAYFGMDYTQPLDTQMCTFTDTPMTWQQYFLACALDSWTSYQAMTIEAEAAGLHYSDEVQADLDALPAQLDEAALSYQMASGEELLKTNFGACVTMEDYLNFWKLYYNGYEYYDAEYEKLKPTAEEVEAYFAENEQTYAEKGVTRDGGKYVDVRHVLLMPDDPNATTGEDGYPVYSEEAWEACRVQAQELYDAWMAGDKSEDSFAELAKEHSVDGSASSGGLYTDVYAGQMVQNFNDWCFDEVRQVGDHALVQTQYGYHIMFFSGSRDIWFATAEAELWSERVSTLVPAAIEAHPYEVDYKAILLGQVALY